MALLLPSLFVLLLHFCSGQVEDADVSGSCESVGADGMCAGKTDRVELFQHAKVDRLSSLKEAAMKMQTGCQTSPNFLSALTCTEGNACTYKETKRGETFTVESSGGFVKVTVNDRSLYMSEEWMITDSHCDGRTLKANILEPAVLEEHSLTCTDQVLRDVTSDNVFSLVASGDSGVDLVDLANDGTVFMDHLEFSGSAPGNGFTVPSGSEVTRSELVEQFSSDCSSLAQADTLDRALSKKGIGAIAAGVGFLFVAGAACAFGGPIGCVGAVGFAKMGVAMTVHGISNEIQYRHR